MKDLKKNLSKQVRILVLWVIVCTASFGQENPKVIPLWPYGAPGFEDRRNEPEQAKDWWVKNIHNPSIHVYFPEKIKSNGAAIVICPGGGHRALVYNSEGRDAAVFLNTLGVTAIVLKYRLFREENSTYTLEKHVREDAYRAMRLVRSYASEWNIDTARIGIMGFSAGGEVAALIAYDPGIGDQKADDPIDRLNGKPNFQILVYPGPLGIPDKVPSNAPPAFVIAANDDVCCSGPVVELLQKYRDAHVSIEAHIFAQGNHAFNMGDRSTLNSIKTWPQRLADWLNDTNIINPMKTETK